MSRSMFVDRSASPSRKRGVVDSHYQPSVSLCTTPLQYPWLLGLLLWIEVRRLDLRYIQPSILNGHVLRMETRKLFQLGGGACDLHYVRVLATWSRQTFSPPPAIFHGCSCTESEHNTLAGSLLHSESLPQPFQVCSQV